jgi:hypothetical protein
MRMVDFGSGRRHKNLHAVVARGQKQGAEDVDAQMGQQYYATRGLARPSEYRRDSALEGIVTFSPRQDGDVGEENDKSSRYSGGDRDSPSL